MRPEESWSLAIDVGTTFCVVAARRGQGEPQVVEIGGQRRVPSVIVVEDDGTLVVGQAAENLAAAQPARALRAPKNRLGDPSPVIVAGRLFDSAALIAALVRHLYDAAVAQHGGTAPASVRLTHPAIWGRPRIDQLRRAAAEAGLPEVELLTEPVAAAMAYAHAHAVPNGTFLAVYDLGGGTFDAAVVQATAEGFVVVGRPVGEDRLGGELFDELLANAVAEQLEPSVREALQLSDETAWMQAAAALRAECRRAKEALSSHPYAELMIPLPTGMVRQQVTREQFEALIEPYVAQSVDRLVQAVADAGLQQSDLAAVCLSGGASYMPMVARAIGAAFGGVAVERRGDPKTAVAVGAALPSGPIGSAGGPAAASTLAVAATPTSPTAGHGPPPPGAVPPGSFPPGSPPPGSFPPGSPPPGSFPSPGSWPPPAPPTPPGSLRRRLLVPALVAVVAVVAVVGALLLRGGGEPLEVAQAGGEATTTTEAEARD
ncbi:MAG: Hsp70 family protein, partial [Acidimicrobiia bacterium]